MCPLFYTNTKEINRIDHIVESVRSLHQDKLIPSLSKKGFESLIKEALGDYESEMLEENTAELNEIYEEFLLIKKPKVKQITELKKEEELYKIVTVVENTADILSYVEVDSEI